MWLQASCAVCRRPAAALHEPLLQSAGISLAKSYQHRPCCSGEVEELSIRNSYTCDWRGRSSTHRVVLLGTGGGGAGLGGGGLSYGIGPA